MKSILIIDDDEAILAAIDTILTDMGYKITTCSEAAEGERIALSDDFGLILVDIKMPGRNGAEIVESILTSKPDAHILVITGYPSDALVRQALSTGAKGVLKKPFEIGAVLDFFESRGDE